jgi:hypothetical protein
MNERVIEWIKSQKLICGYALIISSMKRSCLFLKFFKFYHFYIYSNVYTLSHLSLPPPRLLGRTCSTLLFSNFVEEKTLEIIRKNLYFLEASIFVVWDKHSYTERFLTVPWTGVLQPTLVHLYQTSSLLPSPLPIGASNSLRLLYSLLYSEHINHIQVLGFLLFPYSSHAHSPLSVTHVQ